MKKNDKNKYWLNFQYLIDLSNGNGDSPGMCNVTGISSGAIKHGSASYYVNSVRGGPVKKHVYGETFTEPLNVSILLGEGARPWLKWFSAIQEGKKAIVRNITIFLYNYGADYGENDDEDSEGQLWLRWDLINCFPLQWQIKPMAVDQGPSPMQLDMTLQFESMVIHDNGDELHEVIG